MVSERTAVGRFSRGANGRRMDGGGGGGGGGAGERERSARRKMRAQEARKSEMDSLYYGDRHPFLDIHNCTLHDRRRAT